MSRSSSSCSSACAIWCCSAFLSSKDGQDHHEEDYYKLMRCKDRKNATPDEIRKNYKEISRSLHPDKLVNLPAEERVKKEKEFIKMKEAYETLSNAKKKAMYDQLGEKGMKWFEDPMSIDREEVRGWHRLVSPYSACTHTIPHTHHRRSCVVPPPGIPKFLQLERL